LTVFTYLVILSPYPSTPGCEYVCLFEELRL
jgi:hypothetical protein